MNRIQVGVFLVCSFSIIGCCLAGDDNAEAVMLQKATVDSLKSPEMRQPLQKAYATVEAAQREMEAFQAEVARGNIPIKNNNGLWCAVLDESKIVTKLATYTSKNGPMDYFMKVVYANEDHKAYLNEQGYRLYLFTNGIVRGYMRADMLEMTEYHPDGKIKSFSAKTSAGWYTAKWDGKNGQLLNETSSIDPVGEPSESQKK